MKNYLINRTSHIKLFLINIPFLALLPVYLKIATFVSLLYTILVLPLHLLLHLYVWTLPISNIYLKEGKTISYVCTLDPRVESEWMKERSNPQIFPWMSKILLFILNSDSIKKQNTVFIYLFIFICSGFCLTWFSRKYTEPSSA